MNLFGCFTNRRGRDKGNETGLKEGAVIEMSTTSIYAMHASLSSRFCHLLTATITFLVYASLCAIIFHANLFWRRIRTRRYSMSSVSVSLYTVWCCSSSIRALCSCACNSSNCFLDNISRCTQLSNMALVDSLFSFNLLDIDSEELEAVCVLFKTKNKKRN